MIYLLDVNVLLALRYEQHSLHGRADAWMDHLQDSDEPAHFATCSTTELGFVRIASGKLGFAEDVNFAQRDLHRLKAGRVFTFLTDYSGADRLPEWVEKSKQVTDGHLLQLAIDHGAIFATLDEGIPGALLIPTEPDRSLVVREPYVPYGVAA
jgi:predicted nucleic acid-binding protein